MTEYSDKERFAAAEMAKADFYFFARWMFLQRRGYKWMKAAHHKLVCDWLTKVYNGECKRLIINIPPRYGKTELLLNWITWCLGHAPDSEFILTSYSSTLASQNSWVAREIVQHEAYSEIFPQTQLRSDSSAKNDWRTVQGGVVYAAGAGGTITGYGAGKARAGFAGAIIVDDPHKPDEATSEVMRKNVIDWFQNTLESRKNDPENTPIILIMQRVHESDLAGWLIEGNNGEHWDVVSLPALAEPGDPLGREPGAALWPEKHSVEKLENMRRFNAYVFAAQYQQRPAPLGGGLIKGEWFNRYEQLPELQYRKIYADTAQKTKEHNDYSVFQCWGKTSTGRAYLIDQIRGKWESLELKRRATDFWNKHQQFDPVTFGSLRQMAVEDKASGTGLIQDLRITSHIPIAAIQRDKDKLTRVQDIQGYIESGRIYIPSDAPWVLEFIAECEAFTPNDTHAHDDQIDPMCDAISEMVASNNLISLYESMAD